MQKKNALYFPILFFIIQFISYSLTIDKKILNFIVLFSFKILLSNFNDRIQLMYFILPSYNALYIN